ncbi:MAG: C4-type zinc ribbon domain-containing protein [Bacteroidales bacterium]|jgi:predicted  nucleic acid-binding Zn-ribbon protein|nr:C4-type zinc ribbon domain-containing protein [Bacteroidales bacterium]MDD4528551.1 C4-type zinc ribbon domain-containing protein [Bacteroidales bacterium]MDD4829453.1 C4-type zinc ribbon domain-containing protein [Bacteroidales bacterium]
MAKKVTAKTKAEALVAPIRKSEEADITVERRLIALYKLQQIDSQIDKIRIVRGELPLEVQDLEDEVVGLETRIEKFKTEEAALDQKISDRKLMMKDCSNLIKKYEEQQKSVRNNREYESLSKEVEFQNLEIQLCEKKIKEAMVDLDHHKQEVERVNSLLEEKQKDLEQKKSELNEIIAETEEREKVLLAESEENSKLIEQRYLTAYQRIRDNSRNGLAVVEVDRDACGGCFNKIPHQRQMDIRMHKKIIVCEYCGRILVDQTIIAEVEEQ